MKEVTIEKNDAGQRLDKFLTKSYPSLPQALLYKYIRKKRIKCNGRRAEIATRLQAGDQLELYINDDLLEPAGDQFDFLSASRRLDCLYEDEHILLLNKPVGLLCHPDRKEYGDTLIGRVQRYLYEKGAYDPKAEQAFAPALVNRIDRNTSGIVIAAKTACALRILNQKMKDRELHKYYQCIVHGKMEKPEATLEGYLFKDEQKNKVFIRSTPCPGARSIRTRYRVLDYYDRLSLLEIELLTGRTHQIRAHLASIGHPLLGDGKYGSNALNQGTGYKKQALCSYRLIFDFTTSGEELDYLNHREFQISDVWFAREFRRRKIGGPQ